MAKEVDFMSVVRATKYPREAFEFVQRGLEHTVQQVHGEAGLGTETVSRHISGRQLCGGLRDYAIGQYGLMARAVLRRWRITNCEDFGHIVFAMVDAGMMHKTEEDSIRDFAGAFEFAEAFPGTISLRQETRKEA